MIIAQENMKKKDIEEKLVEIFKKRSGIDFSTYQWLKDKSVFGREINLPPREMVYILSDVERRFCVRIPDRYLVNKKFNSFNAIYQIICNLMK